MYIDDTVSSFDCDYILISKFLQRIDHFYVQLKSPRFLAQKTYVIDQFKFSRFFSCDLWLLFFRLCATFWIPIKLIWWFGLWPRAFMLNVTLHKYSQLNAYTNIFVFFVKLVSILPGRSQMKGPVIFHSIGVFTNSFIFKKSML